MHSPFRKRGIVLASLLALALAAAMPSPAMAKPEPGAKKAKGFRLFARPLGAMTINRIYCGLSSDGQICVDSTNSSTIGGGYWPKGTADQYIFNTGLQLAGIVGSDGGPWAGDTTGAFFFDPKGTTQHGTQVEQIYNTANIADFQSIAAGDQPAAYVPYGDADADLYNPLLQGNAGDRKVQASQGDVWWMSWDGDPALNAGRSHPLGIVVETRGMGWNFPTGNEDIIYFVYTFYNITTKNEADYVNIRPEMRQILLDKAEEFQAKNNATFGVSLPTGGYTINDLYAAFGTDMDVASAGVNYSSVNLPFALGYTYTRDFNGEASWSFDPTIFAPPFFAGAGFAGIKYLKSPSGPGEIQLFSNTVNGSPFSGAFNDPQNTIQLWRYLSGNISVPAGDQPCNTGNPAVTRICWINNTQGADMRFFQSSSGFSLAPGGQGSIVVAYIFAAPVAVPGCSAPDCQSSNLKPGDPTILGNPTRMATGVNLVDSVTGYISASDLDGNGQVEQTNSLNENEWVVVPGSLLGKSYTAQAVFDAKFLLPFAPTAPAFFLIPGNNQVTVMWQPSTSETTGDPYYAVAQDVGTVLYDPNYREFDVEGYRIYRGRTDSPDDLTLVAQFDYAGTVFNDYSGLVNPVDTCAPELDIRIDCPVTYSPYLPGQPRTVAHENPLVGTVVQTLAKRSYRDELATGLAITIVADTAITGGGSSLPPLADTGVPFAFVDNGVRNNFRYFYVVTAFDVNSLTSSPSSLESPKSGTIAVTPQAPATNYESRGFITSQGLFSRNGQLDEKAPVPALDAATGNFAGPMPPANGWNLSLQFVAQVIGSPGSFDVRMDSISLGDSYNGVETIYHLTSISLGVETAIDVPVFQDPEYVEVTAGGAFPAVFIDNDLASLYGGSSSYFLNGIVETTVPGSYFMGGYGRGCTNSGLGYSGFGPRDPLRQCSYNGPRWFAGPSPENNETMANPNFGNPAVFTTSRVDRTKPNYTGWNNAGELPGVLVISRPAGYLNMQTTWRTVEGIGSGAVRAADYNVYWGAAGKVDSVIDVTHDIPVPFNASPYRGGWGFLNQSAANNATSFDARTELSIADVGCVEPYKSLPGAGATGSIIACSGGAYVLSETAIPGPVVFADSNVNLTKTTPAAANPGFIMLLGGQIFEFQLADAGGTLPAAGTVWTMRDYIGGITGGTGYTGTENAGVYKWITGTPRPWTAVGTQLSVNFDAVNKINAVSNLDLTKIHTVPDPYYVTNQYEVDFDAKIIKFVNLPTQATIRIYSSSGVLVRVLNYESPELGGMLDWNVRNRNNQVVASGVYFYHVESGDARYVGRMTIVNFAK